MSSKSRLPFVAEAECCPTIRKFGSSNATMLHFDQLPERNKPHVLVNQSKIPYLKTKLIEGHLLAPKDAKSSQHL